MKIKTSERKKENQYDKQIKTKHKDIQVKNHGTCFVLANFSWAQELPWIVVDTVSDTLLEKTNFLNSYQLQIAS